MKRALFIALVVAGIAGFSVISLGAGEEEPEGGSYKLELDNAFGLVTGADVKFGGIRVGQIGTLEVDRKTKNALVEIKLEQKGFDQLRRDAFCESRPQSLIGEYFVDCQPGKAKRSFRPGETIPIENTGSTIPPDLVNNVLRKPYRERLSLIVNSLGGGLAGRGKDLNVAIRRAVPALRATDDTLAKLADQNEVLERLVVDADRVIGTLADKREDVGRFIVEARDTSRASAERADDISATFDRFPRFLRELRPTMTSLGRVADEQTPALRNLDAASEDAKTFFDDLAPFAEASRPAFETLGETSKTGREAIRQATPTVRELNAFAERTPEVGKNLRIILEHLDNREHSIEDDPDSPGGKGYTGLEALLQYVFDQSVAINVFNQDSYMLKVGLFDSPECSPYSDAKAVKDNPKLITDCGRYLGPNQPGVNRPSIQGQGGRDGSRSQESFDPNGNPTTRADEDDEPRRSDRGEEEEPRRETRREDDDRSPRPERETRREVKVTKEVGKVIDDLLDQAKVPGLPPVTELPKEIQKELPKDITPQELAELAKQAQPQATQQSGQELLDYLLGP